MSTPSPEKEKAKELIMKFSCYRHVIETIANGTHRSASELDYPAMKKWATICVNEVLNLFDKHMQDFETVRYWKQVKQEIDNYEQ